MDIKDVSEEAQYVELLERQRTFQKAFRSRKGQIPKDRTPRQKLVQDHMTAALSMRMQQAQISKGDVYMKSMMIGEPNLPPIARVHDLEKILIKQPRLETNHRGSYLVL
jgi:hypothetical protein